MRFRKSMSSPGTKPDMTPMIDIVFQLMAFFMLVINITKVDQSALIRLPASELAKPPDAPPESPITLQLTSQGTVIFGGEKSPAGQDPMLWLRRLLLRESQIIEHTPGVEVADATIIIRADRGAKTGEVQKLMQLCQDKAIRFQNFKLRARQERL
ncbi:MAG: ExbD/TolR family protein [Planctomycetota bacterium]|jgi:biopolymer transport protein ExbD